MTKAKNSSQKVSTRVKQEADVYTGPLRANPNQRVPADAQVVYMGYAFATNTGSSTGLQPQFSTAFASNCADWAGYIGLYDEVRVLGFEIEWCPRYGDGNNSISHSEGYCISTHSPTNPGPFTSISATADYSDVRMIHTGRKFIHSWRMASTEEAQFVPVASSIAAQGWIIPFFPYATSTSGSYGTFLLRFALQFRGRR